MAEPNRYFLNRLPNFNGNEIKIDTSSWKSYILSMAEKCISNQPANSKNADGGLYVGVSGIAYTFYALSQSESFQKERNHLLSKALEIIKFCEEFSQKRRVRSPTDECGFLLGNAGTYAIAAAIYLQVGNEEGVTRCLKKYVDAGDLCTPVDYVNFGGDEFLVGRAGYLAGALWLNKLFDANVVPLKKIEEICSSMIEFGRRYAKEHRSPCPLMYFYYETEYLGAAHGLSSILQMLLSCDSFLAARPDAERDIKASVQYLLSLQSPSGNFPVAMDELSGRRDELVHWCHGAPGVFYLMAKSFMKWGDPAFKESCFRCGELIWQKGLLKKGPGICHGVAGNGYVFLILYKMFNRTEDLHRANEFANFLLDPTFKKARIPDSPYSLYEGWAGTICFLNDLLHPNSAAFPFMEI